MSTPVVTNQWAGTFDCGSCRRKRLMGEEFSKKALERYRRDGGALKCKACVAATEQEERKAAAAARKQTDAAVDDNGETRTCAGKCGKDLTQASFNRSQWQKGDGKSKCRECVEVALQEEAAQQAKAGKDKIAAARIKVEQAKTPQEIVAAESELAALEAEKVTGLKPVKLSSGRGRGRGRGGRGRGRGGRR